MTNNLLGDINASLKQEEERLLAELNELKQKSKTVELDLKRFRDARSALGEDASLEILNGNRPRLLRTSRWL